MNSEESVNSQQLSVTSEQKSVTSNQLPVNSEGNPQEEESQVLASACVEDNPKLEASAALKTQGVRSSRDGAVAVLDAAATKAARSNSRADVHAYMRLRRSYV